MARKFFCTSPASSSRQGWSLIELIVGLGVGAIVMSGAGMLYLRMQQSNRMAASMAASQSDSQTTWALVRDLFASHTVDAYKPPGWTGSCSAPRMVDCPASWGLPSSVVESCIEFCRKVVDVDSNIGYRELITVGQGCGEDWWDAATGARVRGLNLKTVGSGAACAGTCAGNKQRSDIRVERAVFRCGSGAADKVAKTFLFPDQSSIQAAMGGAGGPMNACLSCALGSVGGTTNKISVQTVFGYAGQLAASKAANIGLPLMDLESVLNQQTLEFQAASAKHMQEVAPGESVQKMYGVAAADISNCPLVTPTLPDANPKYSLCTALPTGGYALSGACAVNEIMVIINDGKANGRTCCPIGDGILSKIPGEVNQEKKEGLCGPDEVATGIKTMTVPYCTKINTQSFSLEPAGGAVYGTKASAGLLGKLAAKYNQGDSCTCPEGAVMIGGHTLANNVCSDQCVKIVPKLK